MADVIPVVATHAVAVILVRSDVTPAVDCARAVCVPMTAWCTSSMDQVRESISFVRQSPTSHIELARFSVPSRSSVLLWHAGLSVLSTVLATQAKQSQSLARFLRYRSEHLGDFDGSLASNRFVECHRLRRLIQVDFDSATPIFGGLYDPRGRIHHC